MMRTVSSAAIFTQTFGSKTAAACAAASAPIRQIAADQQAAARGGGGLQEDVRRLSVVMAFMAVSLYAPCAAARWIARRMR